MLGEEPGKRLTGSSDLQYIEGSTFIVVVHLAYLEDLEFLSMTTILASYEIVAQIYQGTNTTIHSGRRIADGMPVMIKAPRGEYPTARQIASLRYEHEMLKDLDLPGVVKTYGLDSSEAGVALILEDFGGQTLSHFIATRRLDLTTYLKIAITLAETLGKIHQQNIIHKDIKPHNIIVNHSTGQVKITDFGIATRISQESQRISTPNLLEGTLAYMSPEQTGRMNRMLDYRTDLYSLGVTYYQMLTGELPFTSEDPVELIHSHIARTPSQPHDIVPSIPQPVSDIVMKLLSKGAEDRYQSAEGLAADLRECLRQWLATGAIASFPLGRHDVSGVLRISQKLYGREADVAALMAAFERASQGATELMLVAGYSGVGKSVLVNEVHKPIARQRGFFIAGKFDQYRRNIPYASVIQAFRDLIRQICADSTAQTAAWREHLLDVLGVNAQVIIDVIPEVELLTGPQPPVPALGPSESQNRFKMIFQQFIGVFATAEHPLVIFLDDVQWADSASLKLIQQLVTDLTTRYLLLICAYRNNEVSASHPLLLTLDDIRKAGAQISEIVLRSLDLPDVNQLLADTLAVDPSQSVVLAELVRKKTDGNPFFLNQFLKSLHQSHLLTFDVEAERWRWDLGQIGKAAITDNVVELMADNIRKLSPATQHVLQLAACIGNQFDLAILAVINEKSSVATAQELREAIQEGLVVPLDSDYKLVESQEASLIDDEGFVGAKVAYKFLHDRVQQAAYSLIPADQTRQIHLTIGRLMLAHTPPDERDDHIFDIVSQLNIGAERMTDPDERDELARLNLTAGRKAKASTAYESAAGYFASGMDLLSATCWDSDYELSLALCQERSECEFLTGHFDTAEKLFDDVLRHAKSNHDRANVCITRISLYTNIGKYSEGAAVSLEGLRLFGVTFPESEEERQAAIPGALGAVQQRLVGRQIEDLLGSPTMTDPDKRAVVQLLSSLVGLALNVSPNLFALAILEMVNTSLEHGHMEVSAFGYSMYAVVLSSMLADYQSALGFAELAVNLNEKFANVELKNKLYLVLGAFVNHWRNHITLSVDYLKQAYRSSIEIGDIVYAGFAALDTALFLMEGGSDLNGVHEDIQRYLAFVQQTKNDVMAGSLIVLQQVIANLQGRTSSPLTLNDDQFDEQNYLSKLKEHNLVSPLNVYYGQKAQLLFIRECYAEALEMSIENEKTIAIHAGFYLVGDAVFYDSLILSALYPDAAKEQQEQYWDKLVKNCEQMRIWAEQCQQNSGSRYALMRAEMARLEGKDREAAELYDAAIELAEANSFLQYTAIANELAGKFYLACGKRKLARAYLLDAYENYQTWGASAKADALAEKYPAFIKAAAMVSQTNHTTSRSHTSASSSMLTTHRPIGLLDVTTVIKAAQVISGEIVLDQLLTKLMRIVVENAGAQKGVLVLERGGRLIVETVFDAQQDAGISQPATSVEESAVLCAAIVQFAVKSRQPLVVQDALQDKRFANDPYVLESRPKSILCLPLIHQGKLTGVLYLENNLATNAFTPERIELLSLLSLQGAIAIENALLYARVHQRTEELARAVAEAQEARAVAEQAHTQLEIQLETIEHQQNVIREMSVPVLPLTSSTLVMPLVGALDSERLRLVQTQALQAIERSRASQLILDVTGIPVVDTQIARGLLEVTQMAELLGSKVFVVGIRPEVAQALVTLDMDFTHFKTYSTLQQGIAHTMGQAMGQGPDQNRPHMPNGQGTRPNRNHWSN